MEALLGLVAVVAAVAALWRVARRRAELHATPGSTLAKAVPVSDFGEIDGFVQRRRCSCGGAYEIRGEGPVASGEPVRATRVECRECGRERAFYFDIRNTVARARSD